MKSKVSMTAIRKVLSRCRYDPRQGGPLKVIIDSHPDDPVYLEMRAIEIINEARMAMSPQPDAVKDIGIYHDKMDLAIVLLVIAQVIRDQ